MKKKVIALTSIMLASAAAYWYLSEHSHISTDNAYVHSDVTAISPEVGGQVNHIYVKDNQWVKAGEPLFAIDDEDYQANYQIAQASLDVAQSALQNIDTRIEIQQVKIAQAQQKIISAKANARHQGAELKRFERLIKSQSISENQYEAQRTKAVDTDVNLKSAQLLLSSEHKSLKTLQTEKLQLAAQLQLNQARLKLSAIALARTIVTAPFDGYVADRQVQLGKFVQPGMGLIVMVPDYVWVEANFKETQLGDLSAGQSVDVVLDMYPDVVIKGVVDSITPATGAQFSLLPPQNATGNFVKVVQRVPVRIQLTIPTSLQQKVYPGLSAEVSVATQG